MSVYAFEVFNKLDMCLGRCSVYVLTCRVFSVLYFVF